MQHYTYVIAHPVCGYFYLGVRTAKGCTPEQDTKYWGSSRPLKALMEAIPTGWEKQVLTKHESRVEALDQERNLLTAEAIAHPACVNLVRGGKGWRKEYQSSWNAGIPMRPEVKARVSNSSKGVPRGPQTSEHRANLSKARQGIRMNDVQRAAFRLRMQEVMSTPEYRANMSAAVKGRVLPKRTAEHQAKIVASKKANRLAKKGGI